MSRSASSRFLQQTFDGCKSAVYLIDSRNRFVYLNEACRQWLGDSAETLLGQPCVRAEEEATIDPVAAALAPPPGVLQGQTITASIHWTGGPPPQHARFTPFAIGRNGFVLAEVNPTPSPATDPGALDFQSLQAHVHRLRARQPRLEQWLPLLGNDTRTQHAKRQLLMASTVFANVLLIGKEGCGHERIARHLHAMGGEAAGALIAIDAALMDNELLELIAGPAISLLADSRSSRVTFLLRNVQTLAAEPALMLATWLEQFGGRLRCLSTAGRTLTERSMQAEPLPRKLSFALSTLQIELPSLTDRLDDIPLLAAALLSKRQATGSQAEAFSRVTLDLLIAYPWPGDFLELEDCVRHASRVCQRGMIQPEHLPLQIRSWRPHDPVMQQQEKPIQLDQVLSGIERELISRALVRTQQNRSEAAKRLGISRARLLRRIAELGLQANSGSGEEEADE